MSEPNFDRFDLMLCAAKSFGMPSCIDPIRFVISSILKSIFILAFCLTLPQKSLAIWNNDGPAVTTTGVGIIFDETNIGCVGDAIARRATDTFGTTMFANGLEQSCKLAAVICGQSPFLLENVSRWANKFGASAAVVVIAFWSSDVLLLEAMVHQFCCSMPLIVAQSDVNVDEEPEPNENENTQAHTWTNMHWKQTTMQWQ